jgi:hypothetical protein
MESGAMMKVKVELAQPAYFKRLIDVIAPTSGSENG